MLGTSQATPDSLRTHSPKKASLFSAVFPGAGQIYNKKYWKLPIVYGGIGLSIYFIIENEKQYNLFRHEYLDRIKGYETRPELELYSNDQLLTIQNTYRRWRDMSYIATGLIYVLQIVDAAVDAHFFYWEEEMNENVTLRIAPRPNAMTRSIGLSFSLKL